MSSLPLHQILCPHLILCTHGSVYLFRHLQPNDTSGHNFHVIRYHDIYTLPSIVLMTALLHSEMCQMISSSTLSIVYLGSSSNALHHSFSNLGLCSFFHFRFMTRLICQSANVGFHSDLKELKTQKTSRN